MEATEKEKKVLSKELPERGKKCIFHCKDGTQFEGIVDSGLNGPVIRTEDFKKVYTYERFNEIVNWELA